MSLNQGRQIWLSTFHHPRCGLEAPPSTTPAFTCNTYQPMSLLSLPRNSELLEWLEYFYLVYWCVLNTWKHLKNMCWKCSFKPNFQLLNTKHWMGLHNSEPIVGLRYGSENKSEGGDGGERRGRGIWKESDSPERILQARQLGSRFMALK